MRKILYVSLASLMIVGMLASCATSGNSMDSLAEQVEIVSVEPAEDIAVAESAENEALKADSTGWVTAFGNIDNLDVKSYRLRGEGPEGASFDWIDVQGTKVALSDIRRGEWNLYAEAIGEDGTVVATGHLKTFLSDNTPLDTLYLSEENGKGDVLCDFMWSTSQVLYPSVEVYVKTEDGEFMARDKSEIAIEENGHAVWKAEGMDAGSYIVRAILKDEGEIVSGVGAALRVIDGKRSVGESRFVIGKLSTVYGIDLQNSPIDTVEGEIVLSGTSLQFNSDLNDLDYAWFIDGLLLENKKESSINVAEFGLKKGFYRFDCIASSPDGFSSLNTESVFVYVDGDNIACVSEAEADNKKGDIPAGYTEVPTKDVAMVAENAFRIEDIGTVETAEATTSDAVDAEDMGTESVEEEIEEILRFIPAVQADTAIAEAKAEAAKNNLSEEELWQIVLQKLQALVDSGILTDGHTADAEPIEIAPAEEEEALAEAPAISPEEEIVPPAPIAEETAGDAAAETEADAMEEDVVDTETDAAEPSEEVSANADIETEATAEAIEMVLVV